MLIIEWWPRKPLIAYTYNGFRLSVDNTKTFKSIVVDSYCTLPHCPSLAADLDGLLVSCETRTVGCTAVILDFTADTKNRIQQRQRAIKTGAKMRN